MTAPTVRTTLADPRKGITYHIIAYRTVTRNEAIGCIRAYLGQTGRRPLKRGQHITIVTVIGHDA